MLGQDRATYATTYLQDNANIAWNAQTLSTRKSQNLVIVEDTKRTRG